MMERLSERFMYYSGILVGTGMMVGVNDLKHIQDLIDLEEQGLLRKVDQGEWIPQDETRTKFMCSQCKSKNHGGHEKYCPNCGAKMMELHNGES